MDGNMTIDEIHTEAIAIAETAVAGITRLGVAPLAARIEGLVRRSGSPLGAETGWVIERADSEPSRPMYYAGFDWSYDNLKAMRFARQQDAALMARYMFPGEPHRIADHMWCP